MNVWTRRVLACFAAVASASLGHAQTISGAGSSAAAPIYRAWAREYQKASGANFVYESVGSSAGLKKIRAGETGFGASDIAPPEADLARDGLVLFPVAITGIVPVVNLRGVGEGQLRLTGEVLARIFMGDIARWSAPEIREINPTANLPDLPIKVVARSDGSGTTYNFADYLAKAHGPWKERLGVKAQIAWPASATTVAGSEAVARAVKETPGAIGYIDYGYVAEHKLTAASVRNPAGDYVRPEVQAFRAALANSDWVGKGFFTSTLTAQPGKGSWPITMGTFVLVPRVSERSDQTLAALKFFVWSFNHGDALVQQASFVRLPDRVQAAAFKAITSVRDKAGKPLGLNVL